MSSDNLTSTQNVAADSAVVAKLSTLDRYLPIWIPVAVAVGLLSGRLVPGPGRALEKVRYDRLDTVTRDPACSSPRCY